MSSTESAKPLGLGLGEGLGLLLDAAVVAGEHGYSLASMRAAHARGVAEGIAAERDRCAKVAEGAQHLPNDGLDFANGWCSAALQIAQAIRRA